MAPFELLLAEHDYNTNARWGRCRSCPVPKENHPNRPFGPTACRHTDRYDHRLGHSSLLRACTIALDKLQRTGRDAEASSVESLIQRLGGTP